jgi:DNA-binding NtrC family response regulator
VDTGFFKEFGAGEDIQHYRNTLKLFWNIFPSVQIIILCAPKAIRKAVEAVQAGASNYLSYPIDKKEARYVVQTTYAEMRMQSELTYLRDQFWQTDAIDLVQTNCPNMREVFAKVRTVAAADTTVLIAGDTGTGKGVIANLIHRHSTRKDKQFISVHCGAIPENLLESELFGHERGAFTGAVKRKLGKFEIAQGGTIFLDEIGTMPLPAQVKLLQVLQDRIFQRVGGEDIISSNVRVIAASNIDIARMADEGVFRRDLYYRLNVFPIELPPLRERREDIPLLAEVFLKQLNRTHLKRISRIHPDVLTALNDYAWPGNIRELQNLMERAYLLEQSETLTSRSFPRELFSDARTISVQLPAVSLTLAETRRRALEELEGDYLRKQLAANNGRINTTADRAGITTRQLHKLMTKHGIRKEEFKGLKQPELPDSEDIGIQFPTTNKN